MPAARSLLAVLAALSLAAAAPAQPVDEIIARARAYLGPERALDAVQSLRYVGTIEAGPETRGTIEIVFIKPSRQRIEQVIGDLREITALDGYDGWTRREEVANAANWQLTLLDKAQIQRLQANTWENLHFFRGLERKGGRVEYRGEAQIDGRDCARVAFIHRDDIVFTRYFDKLTGRLVMTETEQGGQIREEGEMTVEGIRFPRKLVSTFNNRTVTITFDRVEVNRSFADDLFEVPTLAPGSP